MKFPHFFIDRPIFAAVLSVLILIVGVIAYPTLPVAQYPNIAPPTVVVTATFPGANAETLAETVAAPIEQAINGVQGMMYMSSQSTNDGNYTLTVTFKPGTGIVAVFVIAIPPRCDSRRLGVVACRRGAHSSARLRARRPSWRRQLFGRREHAHRDRHSGALTPLRTTTW